MSPGFRHDDLPIDPQRNVHGPPALGVDHGDRLGHVVGVAAAVLAGLEPQPGAVAGILRLQGWVSSRKSVSPSWAVAFILRSP
jgi:hypothetical protein